MRRVSWREAWQESYYGDWQYRAGIGNTAREEKDGTSNGSSQEEPVEKDKMVLEAEPEIKNQGRRAWSIGSHFIFH